MLKKVFLVFLIVSLSGCFKTGNTRPTAVYELNQKFQIESVQRSLIDRGFKPGTADGINGKKTKKAIRQFQKQQGYPVNGLATTLLLDQLKPGYVAPAPYNDEVVGESTAVAAGIGALAGAAIGALAGGKEGAVIGAVAGGAVGAGTDIIANEVRVGQAKTEHKLNISLDQVRQQNAMLKQNVNDAKQQIKNDKTKMRRIKSKLKSGALTKNQAKKEIAQLKQSRDLLQATYDDLVAKQREWQKYADAGATTPEIDNEIRKLNQEVASLKIQMDELDQLRSISITG